MRFDRLLWVTTKPCRAWIGFVSNKHNPSEKSGFDACISSRITTVIHVVSDHQINYNCFNEPFAVSPYKSLYLDMHGLIFETSIWLLAGSTRLLASEKHTRCAFGSVQRDYQNSNAFLASRSASILIRYCWHDGMIDDSLREMSPKHSSQWRNGLI